MINHKSATSGYTNKVGVKRIGMFYAKKVDVRNNVPICDSINHAGAKYPNDAMPIAEDSTSLYWVDLTAGTVNKIAK